MSERVPGRMFKIGSRGSQLALWQANHIADAMRTAGYSVEIMIIKTLGDQMQDPRFNLQVAAGVDGKGIFTREIEEALAKGLIDLAVHSLKDLPVELDEKFTLAAIPQRADARDVLVSAKFSSLESLPKNAVLGTTSLRRQSQLLARRSDLKFTAMRGNVDTRLRKLEESQVHGLILAAAGLARLGLTQWARQYFSPDVMCPAPGQGAMGIECRADDEETIAALKFLDDNSARFAVTAERLVLASLGGGCQTPIGVHYSHDDSKLYAAVAAPDGSRVIRVAISQTNHDSPNTLAAKATQKVIGAGAKDLLAIQ